MTGSVFLLYWLSGLPSSDDSRLTGGVKRVSGSNGFFYFM
jgi:hypothetical protein